MDVHAPEAGRVPRAWGSPGWYPQVRAVPVPVRKRPLSHPVRAGCSSALNSVSQCWGSPPSRLPGSPRGGGRQCGRVLLWRRTRTSTLTEYAPPGIELTPPLGRWPIRGAACCQLSRLNMTRLLNPHPGVPEGTTCPSEVSRPLGRPRRVPLRGRSRAGTQRSGCGFAPFPGHGLLPGAGDLPGNICGLTWK